MTTMKYYLFNSYTSEGFGSFDTLEKAQDELNQIIDGQSPEDAQSWEVIEGHSLPVAYSTKVTINDHAT